MLCPWLVVGRWLEEAYCRLVLDAVCLRIEEVIDIAIRMGLTQSGSLAKGAGEVIRVHAESIEQSEVKL